MDKVICSICQKSWKTNKGYLAHKCTTGFTPRDPQHFGKRFLQQSKAALKRGKSLTKTREKEINKMINNTKHA